MGNGHSTSESKTTDAVVVVPGIMGSELVDERNKVRWGLSPSVLAKAWVAGKLDRLHVTEEDIAGGRRLRPTRLLRAPGYMPLLGGLEPYGALLNRLSETVVDKRAVREFPYDWRLSIEFNARELIKACEAHLTDWLDVIRTERLTDPKDVRVVVVAHSMGGLVTRYATEALGLGAIVRQVVTLGTPYYGAVKTVRLLATGLGVPVPTEAARRLAITSPGVHDLLPRYRCVQSGTQLRALQAADFANIGGDVDLAGDAATRAARLALSGTADPGASVTLHAVVGADQPTLQSLTIDAGSCTFLHSLDGNDHRGDSTVYRQAAAPAGMTAFPLPQKHGTLAKSPEALTFIADKLRGADTGPPLGTRPIGADIPTLAGVGHPIVVTVTGTDADPVGVSIASTDLGSGVPTRWGTGSPADGTLRFTHPGLPPGLHRVEVRAGGFSAVTDILLITEPT